MIAGCNEVGKGEADPGVIARTAYETGRYRHPPAPGLCPHERRHKEALGDFAKLHFRITKEL